MEVDDVQFCKQAPPIFESFNKVILDHAVGDQILGPTKNPCPSFFRTPGTGNVWNAKNWGNYPTGQRYMPKLPLNAVPRLVAVGDVHGDLIKTRQVLELAKLLGKSDSWIGGETVLVQVGDVFDRGNDELKILYLLEKLRRGAYRQGGAVHVMHGNHETLNMMGKFTYTHEDAFLKFDDWWKWWGYSNRMKEMVAGCRVPFNYHKGLPKPDEYKHKAKATELDPSKSAIVSGLNGRLMAMRPGGPVASEFLARCPAILVIGKSMFVHGGIKYSQVAGGYVVLNGHNSQVQDWIDGREGFSPPDIISCNTRDKEKDISVTWNRDYGTENSEDENIPCKDLAQILESYNLRRLIIGHTIQPKRLINSACDEHVIRIDVGMSEGCLNNPPQALEIVDDEECFVLTSTDRIPLRAADKFPPRAKIGPNPEDRVYAERKKHEMDKERSRLMGELPPSPGKTIVSPAKRRPSPEKKTNGSSSSGGGLRDLMKSVFGDDDDEED
ncbi:hypothetical protein R1flu_018206 [Riccia fluitans]|uniref:Calcineurin-like phosphoesterase domain-containing protein n=1 Tax=Riccia fluitans TaxID=41844 RepID=A0ABD1ZF65_9MARC